ncbi:MAG: hypothetical protein N2558_03885 [Patescibacteria group bacterium]|nr:hypothetical protein [Patescibacteria group bacterium]
MQKPSEREALIRKFEQTLGIRMFLLDKKSGDKMRQITSIADGWCIYYIRFSVISSKYDKRTAT